MRFIRYALHEIKNIVTNDKICNSAFVRLLRLSICKSLQEIIHAI